MRQIYKDIIESISLGKKLLAVLIDPEKFEMDNANKFLSKVHESIATHIFVGGSTDIKNYTYRLVAELKKSTDLPILLFPGDICQISDNADGLLFLSLISGRNPEYLIGKHVESISKLRHTELEIIPTGYILIENGKETSVERVSKTKPMSKESIDEIKNTAKAGEYLGMKLIYLEAGSGALHTVNSEIITVVKKDIKVPLIVGGGIRTKKQLNLAYDAGADMVVIGTVIENDEAFFEKLK